MTALLKPVADHLYLVALPAPGRSLATRRAAEYVGAFLDRLYMGWEWYEAQSKPLGPVTLSEVSMLAT